MDKAISHNTGGFGMLVLTRKKRESIAVGRRDGDEPMLTVTVLEIGSDRVRLGFQGDPDVSVHRWELWERIRPRGAPDEASDAATPTA
jgi:carbon storage regulator CsrA